MVTLELLQAICAAFNSRDCDRICAHFTDDAVFYMASGAEPTGRPVAGKGAIHTVLADRFRLIPDMHWASDYDWVAGPDRGVSAWHVTGNHVDGSRIDWMGCDLFEFRGDLICRKDTYWKIRG